MELLEVERQPVEERAPAGAREADRDRLGSPRVDAGRKLGQEPAHLAPRDGRARVEGARPERRPLGLVHQVKGRDLGRASAAIGDRREDVLEQPCALREVAHQLPPPAELDAALDSGRREPEEVHEHQQAAQAGLAQSR